MARRTSSRSMSRGRVAEGDAAAAIDAAHVAAGNADDGGLHGNVGHAFRFFDGAADGADGEIEIDDQPFAQPLDSAAPSARNFTCFVVQLARSARRFSCCRCPARRCADLSLPKPPLLPRTPISSINVHALQLLIASASLRRCAAVRVHHYLPSNTADRSTRTRPAFACHCAKFSTSIRYLPAKSPSPKCTMTGARIGRRPKPRSVRHPAASR